MRTLLLLLNLSIICAANAQQPSVAWIRKYGNTANTSYDEGARVVVDGSGNVYTTGIYNGSSSSGYNNFGTVKYDPSGNVLWDTTYNAGPTTNDQAYFIEVDDSGNVYVCGRVQQATIGYYDYCTIKYNASGNPLWINTYDRIGIDEDKPNEMKLDKKGYAYVTGFTYDTLSSYDYTTIKYNAAGVTQWIRHYNGTTGEDDYSFAIDIDDSDNVYVSGTEYLANNGDYYMTTVKYDSSGSTRWVRKWLGPINNYAQAVDLVADDSGNVYVAGYYEKTPISYATVIVKYGPAGDSLWVIRDDSLIYQPVSIQIDNAGDIVTMGTGDSGYVTVKYGPMGNIKWKAFFQMIGATPYAMAIDSQGSIYITGQGPGQFQFPDRDYWTVKYDSLGVEKWRISYNGPYNGNDLATSIALDTMGNVLITGREYESGTNSQFGTIKYSQNVGINEMSSECGISCYPNPSRDHVTIKTKQALHNATLKISNSLGQIVKKLDRLDGQSITIDELNLSPGVYFIYLNDGDNHYFTKILIQ